MEDAFKSVPTVYLHNISIRSTLLPTGSLSAYVPGDWWAGGAPYQASRASAYVPGAGRPVGVSYQASRVSGEENPGHCKGAVGVRSCGIAMSKIDKSAVGAKLFTYGAL